MEFDIGHVCFFFVVVDYGGYYCVVEVLHLMQLVVF